MKLESCVDELLVRGEDDWVHAAEVAEVAQSIGGARTDADIQELSIDLVREVVERGLMKIGDVTEDGFQEWRAPLTDAVVRVKDEWTELGRRPNLGEIFWLANTEKGDDRAHRIRRNSSKVRPDVG